MTDTPTTDPTDLLWDYLRGFHAVHHIAMGTKLGLFTNIHEAGEEGCDAESIAADLKLHPPYVDVWCRTGYHYGLLESAGENKYCLAEMMDKLLVDPADPRNISPYINITASHTNDDLRDYPDHFRNGTTHRFQDHGHEFTRHIGDGTAGFHSVVARRMLAGIPGMKEKLEAGASVLDVGCGVGGLMIKIAQSWPNSNCLGIDIDPHGIEQAQENITANNLSDRVAVEAVGPEGLDREDKFDLAVMFEVLHEIDDGIRPEVVKDIAKALKPDGMLFILDETYPSDLAELRDPSFNFAIQTQFNELIWGNIVPTLEMQGELFSNAGLKEIAREPIGGIFTMIVAQKE